MITVCEALKIAESTLSAKRYAHTLGVQKMSVLIGGYCIPERVNALGVAAAFHDITKELPFEEQVRRIEAHGDELTEDDVACPEILHSYTGAYFVREYLKDEDKNDVDEIAAAIVKHTTGAVEMSVFDEIIFLSDIIEEGRTYPSSVKLREYLLSEMREGAYSQNVRLLHEACAAAMGHTIEHLAELGRHVHPRTVQSRDSLISKIRE